jgi:hypothetical protein
MRLIAFLEYAAVLIGIAVIIAGQFFSLRKGFHLGVFLVGAGIALGGIEAVFTRRMPFRASDDVLENYAGLPALIVGLMALVVGAGTLWAGYLLEQAQWHATVQYLTGRPAPLLAAAGFLFLGVGMLMLLNPQGHHTWVWRILVYAPRATVGLLVVAAGAAGIGLGAWEWHDPKAFDAFVDKLPHTLKLLY